MFLTFDHVTKLYGPVIGINHVSFQIGPGITCLFGSNGAGKSTIMKLASGQLRPSQGEVRVDVWRAWSTRSKWHFGYCPDVHRFYEEMSGREFLWAMARLYGQSRRTAKARVDLLLDEVGLAGRADRRIAGYSHGMRQRLKLAQAVLHDPEILLLDEPFGGIDPGGRQEIGGWLQRLADAGKTILLSSHLLAEVEDLASSILVLARGRIIASGTLFEVREHLDQEPFNVEIVTRQSRRLAAHLVAMPEVVSVEVREDTLVVRTRHTSQFFSRLGELALTEVIELERFEVLDSGADAVFGYLERRAV